MPNNKAYKIIAVVKSRKAAENRAKWAIQDGFEKVRIVKVKGKREWQIWAFI